jgi:hypothetical protein
MASRPGRPRALLKDRRNIRRMALDISRAGDSTGSFFVPSVAAHGSTGEEHGRRRRAVAPARFLGFYFVEASLGGASNWAGIFHNIYYATARCKRNIEMTPLCKIEATLPRVLGSREVRLGGVVDEQAGVQPA